MSGQLEQLYQEARFALKARDYIRAGELLRQILQIDENYKDASRLLAQTVKLRRRRWYNHPFLWSVLGVVSIIMLGYLIAPKFENLSTAPAPVTRTVTVQPTGTILPTGTPIPTNTALPAPTDIPLVWKRIFVGQGFPRDTVTAFATDKNDPEVIYAGMQNAGVYKTIDGGLSWQPAHQGLSNTQVESLVIDSQNPNILYAGTMDGVYKTEDGGENWFRVGDGTYLLMDSQDNSHLYARDDNGIYETSDRGNNWATTHPLMNDCPREIKAWDIHPMDGSTLFVGGWGDCGPGIYESKDGGQAWVLIELKDKPNIYSLAVGFNEQGNLSFYVNDQASYDGGMTWFKGCDFTLKVDPGDPYHVYCGGSHGMSVTQGDGLWRRIGLRTTASTAIHVDHLNGMERIIVGGSWYATNHDDGVFISTDGGDSWVNYTSGIGSTRGELKLDPKDNEKMYLAVYYHSLYSGCSLYRSLDGGKNWSEIYHAADWCGPAFENENNFYLIHNNSWQKTWDGGSHWWWENGSGKHLLYTLPENPQSLSVNPEIDGLIYAVGEDIYFSQDAGRSWQPASGGANVRDARLFYKDQGQTMFAIGAYHQAFSTDAGMTWQDCGEDIPVSRSDTRLAFDILTSRLYLATAGKGMLTSTDDCQTWQASNQGLGNLFVNTVAVDPNDLDIVYAGTDGGAYVSFNGGQTWDQINDGLLGATVVYSIVVNREGNVYAATPYGIFRLEKK